MTAVIVLIPAFEPGTALPRIVRELRTADADLELVVVDDGSGPAFRPVLADAAHAGATVLRHPVNRGKGAALKTGLGYVLAHHPDEDVVTADADGQHTASDIVAVAGALRADALAERARLILGCRAFTGRVPLRSRVGNAAARGLFRLAAGWRLSDTQTGLRGIPASLLAWTRAQRGERFEFEQNVLLRTRRDGVDTREVPISTVYLDGNATSHFRPIVDSLRVALPLALFAASSLLAFVVDTLALLLFTALTGALVPSIVAARVVSASVNFAVNRWLVFRATTRGPAGQAVRYAVLALALLASNIVWMQALTDLGMPLIAAKVATEAVLFLTSYGVQRAVVFGRAESVTPADPGHSTRIGDSVRMEHDAPTNRSHA